MDPRIGTLEIEGFRAFRKLRIEGLGRVNLITGRNNTGKSSVLEALRIFASEASPSVIGQILGYHEEYDGEDAEVARFVEGEDFSMISSLFSGSPSLGEIREPIVISTNGLHPSQRLSLSIGSFAEQRDPEGNRRLVPRQLGTFAEADTVLALIIEADTEKRISPLDTFRRTIARSSSGAAPERSRFPVVAISPYGPQHTSALGPMWDNIALSDEENDIAAALRIIVPDIVAVSMIGGETPRSSRTAIVRSKSVVHPVLLRSYGDGLNRLFGIVLSLVNAKGGLLLIDEVENGMHYSVQLDLWRVIFLLARRLDVQVFATSHSWDSVEAFQKAASEDPDQGVLIRLSRRGQEIVATVLTEAELAIVTRDRIEVR